MKGVGVLRFLEFYHKMALHGKNVKFIKIPKTLNAPLFMFSPSRAGGSFLSHEGGEKASDGKMNSRESRCSGSCRGYCVFNHLPDPSGEAWRVLAEKETSK